MILLLLLTFKNMFSVVLIPLIYYIHLDSINSTTSGNFFYYRKEYSLLIVSLLLLWLSIYEMFIRRTYIGYHMEEDDYGQEIIVSDYIEKFVFNFDNHAIFLGLVILLILFCYLFVSNQIIRIKNNDIIELD
jgi:hypothetical protein